MNHFTSLFVTTTLYRVRQRSTAQRGFPAESDVCALSPPPPLEDCYRWRNHAGREGEIVVVAAGINRFRRSAVSICPSRLLLLGRFAPKWFVSGDCRLCGYGARPKADWIDPRVCAADAARRGCRREASGEGRVMPRPTPDPRRTDERSLYARARVPGDSEGTQQAQVPHVLWTQGAGTLRVLPS